MTSMADRAFDLLIEPHQLVSKMRDFIDSLYSLTAEEATKSMPSSRWIDNAGTDQLDRLGRMLGVTRKLEREAEGYHILDNDTFRSVIKWRALVLSSEGTIPDILASIEEIYAPAWARVREVGPLLIRLEMQSASGNPIFLEDPSRWINKAAGVGLEGFFYYEGPFFDFSEKRDLNDNLQRGGFGTPWIDFYNLIGDNNG